MLALALCNEGIAVGLPVSLASTGRIPRCRAFPPVKPESLCTARTSRPNRKEGTVSAFARVLSFVMGSRSANRADGTGRGVPSQPPSDPKPALTVRPIKLDGKFVPAYERVWVWSRSGGYAEVEFREQRGTVPEDALLPYPVRGPELQVLRQLDPCFGLADEAFECEHIDRESFFEILRCKAHGRRFLRDTRGMIGWYSMLTLLHEDEEGSPKDIWSRYHLMPDSQLLLDGRTMPL
jgi:hypothetical protein